MSNSMPEALAMAVGCIWATKPATNVTDSKLGRKRYKKLRVTMTMLSPTGFRGRLGSGHSSQKRGRRMGAKSRNKPKGAVS
jgi:hypothetical protein